MVDERLSGLALMYIHKDIDIDLEAALDNFARCLSKKRKVEFLHQETLVVARTFWCHFIACYFVLDCLHNAHRILCPIVAACSVNFQTHISVMRLVCP